MMTDFDSKTDDACDVGLEVIPPLPQPSGRREYVTLNGMRGVAAIAVMLFHGVQLVGPVFPRGYLAVDLFFVLSGFVIAHAYDARLSELGLWGFARMRVLRFWPLYTLGLSFGLVRELLLIATKNDYALSPPQFAMAFVLGLAFLPFPLVRRGNDLFTLNVPSWSLFYELLVNILYAAVKPRLSTIRLIAVIAISAVALAFIVPASGIGHVGVTSDSFAGGCIRTILSFSLGILVHRHPPRIPTPPVAILLAMVAAALAWPWGGRSYDIAFVFLISPILVALGVNAEPTGRIAAFSSWLGLISFPLYAIHRPLLEMAKAIINHFAAPSPLFGWLAILVVLMLAPFANRIDLLARRGSIRRGPAGRGA